MTEHEMLKEICDKIGYEVYPRWIKFSKREWHKCFYTRVPETDFLWYVDVREIIFTQEFMDKFMDTFPEVEIKWLLLNLDKPVEYLYELMK